MLIEAKLAVKQGGGASVHIRPVPRWGESYNYRVHPNVEVAPRHVVTALHGEHLRVATELRKLGVAVELPKEGVSYAPC